MADSSASSENASLRPERLWTALRRIVRYVYPYRYRLAAALVLTCSGRWGRSSCRWGCANSSTLMGLLPRFYDPQEGAVRVDGHDLRAVTRSSLRTQIAAVSQEVHLFNTSVRETIRYRRLETSGEAVGEAACAVNAHGFIDDLPDGYDAEVGERGVKLGPHDVLMQQEGLYRDLASYQFRVREEGALGR